MSASGSLTPGSTVTATVTTRNVGTAAAGASTTKLFASRDRFRGADDILLGQASIPALGAGVSITKTISAKVPSNSQNGELLACADTGKVVSESSEGNNCRSMGDTDLDGWANFTDCAPTNALISPGAVDKPDVPAFADTNCDGIDGNARQAIFVSPTGNNSNPGTRAKPLRTLAAAVPLAASKAKDVYAAVGVYTETLYAANGVGVYGGYGTSWARTRAKRTRIVGPSTVYGNTVGAVANNITVRTTLQLLTLAPSAPTAPGASSYGLRGLGSPGLRLDHMTVRAASGVAGFNGGDGIAGQPGGDGGTSSDPLNPPPGGSSAAGHVGGNGGPGGNWLNQDHVSGWDGGPGQSTTPDAWGLMGGPGGPGGSEDTIGGRGYFGDSGKFLGNGRGGSNADMSSGSGFWTTDAGTPGLRGTDGHGGGGGGGGGGESCFCPFPDQGGHGGGGGGGGQGGGGGGYGQGGGGSFGIFLENSTGAIVRSSTVIAAAGGAGGAGGAGAWGGLGGQGGAGGAAFGNDAAAGGDGGGGGVGGRGGDGGGGAGGPSIAILGLTSGATPGTTVQHGAGGAGGAGGYGSGGGGGYGADGLAADYL